MIIYLITNIITGKKYIGQTTRTLEQRLKEHKREGNILHRAISKYGISNFKAEELKRCSSINELNDSETELIKEYNTLVPNGYNLDSGGLNKTMHSESKIKMSLAKKGRKLHENSIKTQFKKSHIPANKGRKHSQESKNKMRKARLGKKNSPKFGLIIAESNRRRKGTKYKTNL